MWDLWLWLCDWRCRRNWKRLDTKAKKLTDERLDLLLSGLIGAFNKWADRIGPAASDKSIHQAITDGFKDIGKWQSLQKDAIEAGFLQVAEAIANSQPLPQPQPKLIEVKFMFIVKDDAPDANFSVVLGDVTDAEGNAIPDAQLTLAVLSTDESVVAVTFDPATKAGSVHFGNPGTATVTATVSSGETLLGSGAADFTVTVGDPAAISSVALSFDGLTEA